MPIGTYHSMGIYLRIGHIKVAVSFSGLHSTHKQLSNLAENALEIM